MNIHPYFTHLHFMKQIRIIPILLTSLFFAMNVLSQDKKPVSDYLQVPGPVNFDHADYNLSWSSHPTANYYKQEYLQKGENEAKFKAMVLIELATGNINAKNAVQSKVEELKKMKAVNPIVNYELITNPSTGEYMLDFLLTQDNAKTGVTEIIERNVYRYKNYTGKNGQSGVLLFAVSSRAYGNEVNTFLASLKSKRKDLVNKVSAFKIPDVVIK